VHPDNPRCFEFRGRPLALVTATEHYGAVMNRPFRFERYLADAAERGITLTRLFMLFREQQSVRNPYSTCKPESPDYVTPFQRTGPGRAADGEPKFDLDRPNPEFFDRLHGFLTLASERGIVVEVTLLSNVYAPSVWSLSPLYHDNNVNGLPALEWPCTMSLRYPELFERQAAHVRRIVEETNGYDNVIYEICNEPGAFTSNPAYPTPAEVDEWQMALAAVIREAEAGLPDRHLIASQQAFIYDPFAQPADQALDDLDLDVVNIHPLPNTTHRGRAYDMGEFMSKTLCLRAVRDFCVATAGERKPINLDEDNVASIYRDAEGWTIHRKRAWVTLMGGCHYDYIDFSIQPWLETGTPESQAHIRAWMGHLSRFIHSLDLSRARVLPGWLTTQPQHTVESVLAVEGEQYRVYLADERELDEPGAGGPIGGEIAFDLPLGRWAASCYSPTTGAWSPAMPLEGGAARLGLPEFTDDLALRIVRA
jgi:hypothetical protein